MRAPVLIVMVNFRTAGLAIESLKSIAREIGPSGPVRVVVVDNQSGDGSVEALRQAIADQGWTSWASVLASDRNSGFAGGNNRAIRQELARAPGDRAAYVLLLNPDTLLRRGALQALIEFLDRHPQAGIAGSRIEDLEGRAQGSARRFPTPLGELESAARFGPVSRALRRWAIPIADAPEPMRCDWVSGAAMMIRAELFSSVGLLDEGYFLYYEETDFCFRASRDWQVWYVPQSRVVHFEGAATGIRRKNRRRPAYWFESRRRFFIKTQGPWRWFLADCCWALGRLTWTVQKLSGLVACRDNDPRSFASDLIGGDWRAATTGAWRSILESPEAARRAGDADPSRLGAVASPAERDRGAQRA